MLRCPGVGNCHVLKSREWGLIYYILAKKIQIPGVLPGGGMVTAGMEELNVKYKTMQKGPPFKGHLLV